MSAASIYRQSMSHMPIVEMMTPCVSFEVGDACALPFADTWFDHSVSMLALSSCLTSRGAGDAPMFGQSKIQ
jgi:hypothetical protein